MKLEIKCNNHACPLNTGCQNYFNSDSENSNAELQYIRPKIIMDGFNKPRVKCEYLMPLNVNYIVNYYRYNSQHAEKIARQKLAIVDEFGQGRKQELMKKINKLTFLL